MYSGDLNSKLVQYLNGPNSSLVEWFVIQAMIRIAKSDFVVQVIGYLTDRLRFGNITELFPGI